MKRFLISACGSSRKLPGTLYHCLRLAKSSVEVLLLSVSSNGRSFQRVPEYAKETEDGRHVLRPTVDNPIAGID